MNACSKAGIARALVGRRRRNGSVSRFQNLCPSSVKRQPTRLNNRTVRNCQRAGNPDDSMSDWRAQECAAMSWRIRDLGPIIRSISALEDTLLAFTNANIGRCARVNYSHGRTYKPSRDGWPSSIFAHTDVDRSSSKAGHQPTAPGR